MSTAALPSPRIRRVGAAVLAVGCLLAVAVAGGRAATPGTVKVSLLHGEHGIAFPRGSALAGPVNRALSALMTDGTLAKLEKKWLTVRLGSLPVLR